MNSRSNDNNSNNQLSPSIVLSLINEWERELSQLLLQIEVVNKMLENQEMATAHAICFLSGCSLFLSGLFASPLLLMAYCNQQEASNACLGAVGALFAIPAGCFIMSLVKDKNKLAINQLPQDDATQFYVL